MGNEDALAAAFLAPLTCLPTCFFSIFWVLYMAFMIGVIAFWIWMLVDVAKRNDDQFPPGGNDQKLLWILIVVLTGGIGSLIYYFLVYRKVGPAK